MSRRRMEDGKKDTAGEIIEAAQRLFYEKGYENATTREISERVGLSKAALYHHFKNKEEILFKICILAAEELIDNMKEAIDRSTGPGGPMHEQLKDILLTYARTFLKSPSSNKILFHDIEYLPEGKKRSILDKEKENVHQLREYLQRLMAEGKLHTINPTVMTFSLVGALHWLFFWYKPGGPLSLDLVVEQIAETFLFGAAVEERPRKA